MNISDRIMIMKDNEKMNRRTFLKRLSRITLGTALVSTTGYSYMKYIEPNWIEITRHDINHPLIPPIFNDFKIVQFSDTHIGFHLDITHFEKVIQTISKEQPDLIIFTGDLIDNLLTFYEYEEIILLLSYLKAPYGKFAVYGNHDHGGWGTDKYKHIMDSAEFILLKNDAEKISIGQDGEIYLAGLDDAMLGKPNFEETFKKIQHRTFTLFISHAPDMADEARNFPVDYQLSGHTHGGQVQLPFIGPLITPPYGQKYVEGLYRITNDFTLYVNRGIGTTRLPFRLLSRPEITIFTLKT